jgi:hypothetical protein
VECFRSQTANIECKSSLKKIFLSALFFTSTLLVIHIPDFSFNTKGPITIYIENRKIGDKDQHNGGKFF